MDIEKFLAQRRPVWNRLEELLEYAENSPEWELGPERIQELVSIYRQACSDLNQARSYTANPDILNRLNNLTGRAYRFVYQGTRRKSVRESLNVFFFRQIPQTFRRHRSYMLLAALSFFAGAVMGMVMIMANPDYGKAMIPAMFFTERPSERVKQIESGEERIDSVEEASTFAASLYTHNLRVSFLAFSLGALTIAGGLIILFYNGIILGAIAMMYFLDNSGHFFLAWVGPHGALEIPAIIFAGAAGLKLGRALLMPGELTRRASLRASFPAVWRIMITVALTLIMAGMIEGSISQFSAKTVSYNVKIIIASSLFLLLMAYLFLQRKDFTDRSL